MFDNLTSEENTTLFVHLRKEWDTVYRLARYVSDVTGNYNVSRKLYAYANDVTNLMNDLNDSMVRR